MSCATVVNQNMVVKFQLYKTNDLLNNKLHINVPEQVVSSKEAPQGTVLSPFLFTLYTSDF